MVYCLKICGKAGWKVTDSKRPEPKKQEANLADEILPPIKEHLALRLSYISFPPIKKSVPPRLNAGSCNRLNAEFALKHSRNPFESIKSRIKTPASILEKLERRGYEFTVESIECSKLAQKSIAIVRNCTSTFIYFFSSDKKIGTSTIKCRLLYPFGAGTHFFRITHAV